MRLAEKMFIVGAGMLTLSISGCFYDSAVEKDYGNSVRHMIQAQTLDPNAAARPDPNPVDSGDGQRLENVLQAYREDVSEPEDVKQDIVINVGGGR